MKHRNITINSLSELIGEENTIKVIQTYGGEKIYIPQEKTIDIDKRNNSILNDYEKGLSYVFLAVKYRLSERQIRNIIAKLTE